MRYRQTLGFRLLWEEAEALAKMKMRGFRETAIEVERELQKSKREYEREYGKITKKMKDIIQHGAH